MILPIREILGQYFGLINDENPNNEAQVISRKEENEMNFVSKLKK